MVATPVPLLSLVNIPFITNAAGPGPANPVMMLIGASPSSDFEHSLLSLLATATQTNPTAITSALLPRGITFLRFRAVTPIPGGTNYISFPHHLSQLIDYARPPPQPSCCCVLALSAWSLLAIGKTAYRQVGKFSIWRCLLGTNSNFDSRSIEVCQSYQSIFTQAVT